MQACPRCSSPQPGGDTCLDCGAPLLDEAPPDDSAAALVERALAALARGQQGQALDHFYRATVSAPRDERAWLGRVLLTARLQTRFDTKFTLHQARLYLDHGGALAHLAAYFHEKDQLTEPEIARSFLWVGRDDAALFVVDFALALCWDSPADSAPLWALKAEIEIARQDFRQAVGSLMQAEALGDTSDAARYVRGLDREREGKPEQALEEYEIAMRHAGLRPLVLLSAARLLASLGRTAEALARCKESLTLGGESAEIWKIYTKLALMKGLTREAREGIEALARLGPGSLDPLSGYPAPLRPVSGHHPETLFALKLPRLLEERGLLLSRQILVHDWCFSLPQRAERWPLGALAGQSLTAALITREQHAFVACHAPAPRLIDAAALGSDTLNAWCYLLENGRMAALTFVGNTLFAPATEAAVREASERLAAEGSVGPLSLLVVGERAGVFG